jgi:hypothetical protein
VDGASITVPSSATKTQIDACVAKAVATGAGTWVVFPAGTFAYSGTFIVPDGINVRGQGIWNQGRADGGGGTWLQCSNGLCWGSNSTIEDMLVGKNTAGLTCTFHPVPRGSSAAGPFTQAHGSNNCTFSFVRFKGGSDSGAALIDLGSNYGSGIWTGTVKTEDMIDTNWYDCEFERPQVTNATAGTSSGAIMNLWLDCRAGGAQICGNGWYRCHFGVDNGYHTGVDGYGVGRTILLQPSPSEGKITSTGPFTNGSDNGNGNYINTAFDWSQINHGFSDNRFQNCLFEYSLWYPMNICDYARIYSTWHGCMAYSAANGGAILTNGGAALGWGNPPSTQWANIPSSMWLQGLTMTNCYFKGSYGKAQGVVAELGKNCAVTNCYCGTGSVFNQGGKFGNVVSGSFSNATRPATAIFPAGSASNWTGTTTSYTPSPYDP